MASTSGKEQFVKQFELIIDGVQRNKTKVTFSMNIVILMHSKTYTIF